MWFEILLLLCVAIAFIISYYMRVEGELRESIEEIICVVEQLDEVGEIKMEEAILQAREVIPIIFRPLFSDTRLQSIIQDIFNNMEAYAQTQLNK